MNYQAQSQNSIILNSKNLTIQVQIEEILYFQCDSYLVTVHFANDEPQFSYTSSLAKLEMQLSEFGFIRINKNQLVNMRYIKYFKRTPEMCIELKNEVVLKVSRRKWLYVKNALSKSADYQFIHTDRKQ